MPARICPAPPCWSGSWPTGWWSRFGTGSLQPEVVATFPQGEAWPRLHAAEMRHRRVRRTAALVVLGAGFLSLLSALAEPFRDRLDFLNQLFPIAVPETAAALAALGAVGLIVLARGVRRGQRRAWLVCLALLIAVAVLHLVKGVDVEEALVALAVAGYLWLHRASFEAKTDVARLGRGLLSVAGAAVLTVVAGTLAVELGTWIRRRPPPALHRLSWPRATQAVARAHGRGYPHRPPSPAQRVLLAGHGDRGGRAGPGLGGRPVPAGRAASPPRRRPGHGVDGEAGGWSGGAGVVRGGRRWWMAAGAGGGVAGGAGARAGVVGPAAGAGVGGLARARAVVARHGAGHPRLLRPAADKQFFFWGDTVVAHAVYGGVCLVSPDPIGPVAEREEAWRAFRRYVDEHGWALGGLGVGRGMAADLPGHRNARPLRGRRGGGPGRALHPGGGPVQGAAPGGQPGGQVRLPDLLSTIPSDLDPVLRAQLEDVMTKSRRGDVERGFSMTLGRAFDPDDAGLLLAVVHGPAEPEEPPPRRPSGRRWRSASTCRLRASAATRWT